MMKNRAGVIVREGEEAFQEKPFPYFAMLHIGNSFSLPAKGRCSLALNHLSIPTGTIYIPLFTGAAKVGQTGMNIQGHVNGRKFVCFSAAAHP